MEREDVLDTTPHPIFTPTTSHTLIPTSDPSTATSVLKSEVDTDEMNPDKRTYNPSSTMEDDLDRELSVTPIAKRTYTKVASPKCKPGVATSTKTALDTRPVDSTPAMPKGAQSTVARERKVGNVVQPDSAKGHTSSSTPTALSQPLNPTAPAPVKKRCQKVPSPQVSETEPDSPPPAPKPHSLQRLGNYLNLGDFDPSLQETVVTSEKKLLGSKAVVLKVLSNDIGEASTSDPAPSW